MKTKKTKHHCPKGKLGGKGPSCREVTQKGISFCKTHSWQCPVDGHETHIQLHRQACKKCEAKEEADARKEAHERADEISATNPKLNKSNDKK
jgi:hypothetical protein